jgi:hypothetical protein
MGFVTGSLGVVWPWKNKVFKRNGIGELILDSNGNNRIENYQRYVPDPNTETLIAILLIILGAAIVLGLQWYGKHQKNTA